MTYTIVALGSPVASVLVMKLDSRFAVRVGSVAYLFYVAGVMIPTIREKFPNSDIFLFKHNFIYFIVLFFSCIKGFGGSLFWVGGLSFVRECSDDTSKGLFFALLYTASNASSLLGSLLSGLILGYTDKFTYFMVMFGISCFSVIWMLFLKKPRPMEEEEK